MAAVAYRLSCFFFGAIVLLIVWAFWPGYFSSLSDQRDVWVHAHALSQTAWCLMLLGQAWAIGCGRTSLHKSIGPSSALLVGVIVLSTLALMHQRMQGLQITDGHLKVAAFNLATLAVFVLLYTLAILQRGDRGRHAGFMICTAFPFFTAFVPRLIERSGDLVAISVSVFGGFVALGQAGLLPADIMVAVLSVRDWQQGQRRAVFPVALGCLLGIHLSTVTLYRFSTWRSAVESFVGIP